MSERPGKQIIEELFKRFIDKAYPTVETAKDALLNRKLTIYLGVDPTGPHMHLGHATNLLVLKKLQELDHHIIFLIGDFTGRIGDPTGKTATRVELSKDEVQKNFATFKTQAAKLISFSGKNAAEVRRNSEWHNKLTFEDVIALAKHFTLQQMIERDMFQERLKKKEPIGLHEFFYPLMQGYDSVAMNVDAELGGNDQTFNMLIGRTLQKTINHKEKLVLTTKLLINPATGEKLMNKSHGGLINLDDEPNNMFGKVMALEDSSMLPLATLSTEIQLEKIDEFKKALSSKNTNPRDIKLEIAYEVVRLYHSEKDAVAARENFVKTFSKRGIPDESPTIVLKGKSIPIIDLLLMCGVESKSEARRLLETNAVHINHVSKVDPKEIISLKGGELIKIGKHRFFKII